MYTYVCHPIQVSGVRAEALSRAEAEGRGWCCENSEACARGGLPRGWGPRLALEGQLHEQLEQVLEADCVGAERLTLAL